MLPKRENRSLSSAAVPLTTNSTLLRLAKGLLAKSPPVISRNWSQLRSTAPGLSELLRPLTLSRAAITFGSLLSRADSIFSGLSSRVTLLLKEAPALARPMNSAAETATSPMLATKEEITELAAICADRDVSVAKSEPEALLIVT